MTEPAAPREEAASIGTALAGPTGIMSPRYRITTFGNSAALQVMDTLCAALTVGAAGAIITGFGAARLPAGLAVSGLLVTAIGGLAVAAAYRIKERRA